MCVARNSTWPRHRSPSWSICSCSVSVGDLGYSGSDALALHIGEAGEIQRMLFALRRKVEEGA